MDSTTSPDRNAIAELIIAEGVPGPLAYDVAYDRATFSFGGTFNRLVDNGYHAGAVRRALNIYDRVS